MAESDVQDILYEDLCVRRGKGHRLICPNVKAWGWESDLISVTKSGYAVEYEIKCSVQDFRRDKEKRRHRKLTGIAQDKSPYIRRGFGPCRFFYVFSGVDYRELDIPDYAGVITVDNGVVQTKEKAPRIHSIKMSDDVRRYLERGLVWRYWNER